MSEPRRPSFSEALHRASYCPPPLRVVFSSKNNAPSYSSHGSASAYSGLKTPSLTTASSTDYSVSSSLKHELLASAPPVPISLRTPLLSPMPCMWKSCMNKQPSSRSSSRTGTASWNNEMHIQQLHSKQFIPQISAPSSLIDSINESETRSKLLDLQKKYDDLLDRLNQTTQSSETMTAELCAMKEDLNKARKGCITLTDIVKELAHDELDPYLSFAKPSSNAFAVTDVPLHGLSQSSPDVTLSAPYVPESTLLTDPSRDQLIRVQRSVPSPNNSLQSTSGSSRASSRNSASSRKSRKVSSAKKKRVRRRAAISPSLSTLYTVPLEQIPLITELIASTEAELRSFQLHLDDVLSIAKQDPNRTWERGEEIRLLCQAISAKKTALGKLRLLQGETDKALGAMELDVEQLEGLGQKIRSKLRTYNALSNELLIANTRPTNVGIHGIQGLRRPGVRNRRALHSARPHTTRTADRLYPLTPTLRPRSISASRRHEKCVERPAFEPFRARPNPFPPPQ